MNPGPFHIAQSNILSLEEEDACRLRLGLPSSSGRSGAAATASFRKSSTASECTNALLRTWSQWQGKDFCNLLVSEHELRRR